MQSSNLIHVAVGVITNEHDEVLISKRHPDSHKGGFWEFPGGKKEHNEAIHNTLQREFEEELGITPTKFHPFTKILHQYPEKQVLLDVWVITEFVGDATGREGQEIEWRKLIELRESDFPEANAAIIKKLQLPKFYAITPNLSSMGELSQLFSNYAAQSLNMVQLRQPQLTSAEYAIWLDAAAEIALSHGIHLIANQAFPIHKSRSAIGYHANASRLLALTERPVAEATVFSASCHSLAELEHAAAVDADFVTLSPVSPTLKYNADRILGWEKFRELAGQVSMPVYALGGLEPAQLGIAISHGAHGVAGISCFVSSASPKI